MLGLAGPARMSATACRTSSIADSRREATASGGWSKGGVSIGSASRPRARQATCLAHIASAGKRYARTPASPDALPGSTPPRLARTVSKISRARTGKAEPWNSLSDM